MHPEPNSNGNQRASLSRRNFLQAAAAVGTAAPTIAISEQSLAKPAKLPIERFTELSEEISDVLNEYLNGKYCAHIYPSNSNDLPIWLQNISFENRKPPVEERYRACVDRLVSIFAEMYPDTDIHRPFFQMDDDGAWRFAISGSVDYIDFDGDGFYEVSDIGVNSVYWLEKRVERSARTGEVLLNCTPYYLGTQWDHGAPVGDPPRRMYPKLVRKLSGVPV